LFLPNEFHEELLYQFEDKDADLRQLVFGFLTPLGKQGKMVILNKNVQAQILVDGKRSMKVVPLDDIDLEKSAVASDGQWIPEKVKKEEIKIYSLTVSNRLHEDLVTFGKVFCAQVDIFNDSLDKKHKDYKEQFAKMPTCFEQIIQDHVINQLSTAIAGKIDDGYKEEFAELEKQIEDKKSPKRDSKKKE